MNKKYLFKIIKNYDRNKKRIEEIKKEIYALNSIDYTQTSINAKGSKGNTAELVYSFENNPEKIKLQNQINAVDRMLLRLDYRQKRVYSEIITKNRKAFALECEGISERTVYRLKNEILYILNEELIEIVK